VAPVWVREYKQKVEQKKSTSGLNGGTRTSVGPEPPEGEGRTLSLLLGNPSPPLSPVPGGDVAVSVAADYSTVPRRCWPPMVHLEWLVRYVTYYLLTGETGRTLPVEVLVFGTALPSSIITRVDAMTKANGTVEGLLACLRVTCLRTFAQLLFPHTAQASLIKTWMALTPRNLRLAQSIWQGYVPHGPLEGERNAGGGGGEEEEEEEEEPSPDLNQVELSTDEIALSHKRNTRIGVMYLYYRNHKRKQDVEEMREKEGLSRKQVDARVKVDFQAL